EVKNKIDGLKKALESNDSTRIRAAKDELDRHMQHIGEAMAKAGGGAQPHEAHAEAAGGSAQYQQQQQSPHGKPGDDIEEAEVEIIDDKKP
ncbi:MAG: hypothetical protein ACHQUC_09680, partial [Chlamydiales bacterium]